MLQPCPGCGALFPPSTGPTHRYIGASSACWAFFGVVAAGYDPEPEVLARSMVTATLRSASPSTSMGACGLLIGDAYAVQHHGADSPQAVQSVAAHLLVLHGALLRGVSPSNRLWVLGRALRKRRTFHKLEPPPVGKALTIRHLFPGERVGSLASRDEYVRSVYEAWAEVHTPTIERWYDRYVVPDQVT